MENKNVVDVVVKPKRGRKKNNVGVPAPVEALAPVEAPVPAVDAPIPAEAPVLAEVAVPAEAPASVICFEPKYSAEDLAFINIQDGTWQVKHEKFMEGRKKHILRVGSKAIGETGQEPLARGSFNPKAIPSSWVSWLSASADIFDGYKNLKGYGSRAWSFSQAVYHPDTGEKLMSFWDIENALKSIPAIKMFAVILHDQDLYAEDEYAEDDTERKNPIHVAGSRVPPHWHVLMRTYDETEKASGSNRISAYDLARHFNIHPKALKLLGKGANVEVVNPDGSISYIGQKQYLKKHKDFTTADLESAGFFNMLRYILHETQRAEADGKHKYSSDDVVSNFDVRGFIDRSMKCEGQGAVVKTMMDVHLNGKNPEVVKGENPALYVMKYKQIREAFKEYKTRHAGLPPYRTNIYCWGEGGSGKSVICAELALRLGSSVLDAEGKVKADDNPFHSAELSYFTVGRGNVLFDGNLGQPVNLYDDTRPDALLDSKIISDVGGLMNLWETHPKSSPLFNVKYGAINVNNQYNIINSVKSAFEFCRELMVTEPRKEQISRRIGLYIKFVPKGKGSDGYFKIGRNAKLFGLKRSNGTEPTVHTIIWDKHRFHFDADEYSRFMDRCRMKGEDGEKEALDYHNKLCAPILDAVRTLELKMVDKMMTDTEKDNMLAAFEASCSAEVDVCAEDPEEEELFQSVADMSEFERSYYLRRALNDIEDPDHSTFPPSSQQILSRLRKYVEKVLVTEFDAVMSSTAANYDTIHKLEEDVINLVECFTVTEDLIKSHKDIFNSEELSLFFNSCSLFNSFSHRYAGTILKKDAVAPHSFSDLFLAMLSRTNASFEEQYLEIENGGNSNANVQ